MARPSSPASGGNLESATSCGFTAGVRPAVGRRSWPHRPWQPRRRDADPRPLARLAGDRRRSAAAAGARPTTRTSAALRASTTAMAIATSPATAARSRPRACSPIPASRTRSTPPTDWSLVASGGGDGRVASQRRRADGSRCPAGQWRARDPEPDLPVAGGAGETYAMTLEAWAPASPPAKPWPSRCDRPQAVRSRIPPPAASPSPWPTSRRPRPPEG